MKKILAAALWKIQFAWTEFYSKHKDHEQKKVRQKWSQTGNVLWARGHHSHFPLVFLTILTEQWAECCRCCNLWYKGLMKLLHDWKSNGAAVYVDDLSQSLRLVPPDVQVQPFDVYCCCGECPEKQPRQRQWVEWTPGVTEKWSGGIHTLISVSLFRFSSDSLSIPKHACSSRKPCATEDNWCEHIDFFYSS